MRLRPFVHGEEAIDHGHEDTVGSKRGERREIVCHGAGLSKSGEDYSRRSLGEARGDEHLHHDRRRRNRREVDSASGEAGAAAAVGTLSDRIHNHVVAASGLCEVGRRVVDDLICAELCDKVMVAGTADRRHVRAEVAGQLDRRCSDRARGAIDEHSLPSPQLGAVAHERKRG